MIKICTALCLIHSITRSAPYWKNIVLSLRYVLRYLISACHSLATNSVSKKHYISANYVPDYDKKRINIYCYIARPANTPVSTENTPFCSERRDSWVTETSDGCSISSLAFGSSVRKLCSSLVILFLPFRICVLLRGRLRKGPTAQPVFTASPNILIQGRFKVFR